MLLFLWRSIFLVQLAFIGQADEHLRCLGRNDGVFDQHEGLEDKAVARWELDVAQLDAVVADLDRGNGFDVGVEVIGPGRDGLLLIASVFPVRHRA